LSTPVTCTSMELLTMRGVTAEHKAESIVDGFPSVWAGQVLDIGCRSRELERAVARPGVSYFGLDLSTSADAVADLGVGLPFPDQTADVVVALDVLEHTDRIHHSFSELCRVARRHVVLSLPNEYDASARWKAVRGKHSGKWGLPLAPRRDRHRWLFTLHEARQFCEHVGSEHGWVVAQERALVGPRRGSPLSRGLVRRWPNLFAPTYVAVLQPAG
jgi:2-polyprenyl-3-methyl-5-hydroxy-6-metoxy-1,4-benzoquinol methylase